MKLVIVTRPRADHDWVAEIKGNEGVWESGSSQAEAIGKLIITLCCKMHSSVGYHDRFEFTLPLGQS